MKQNYKIRLLSFLIILLFAVVGHSQNSNVSSDQWTATDALSRKLPEASETGKPKQDKFIAIFYWTWHQGDDDTTYQVKNNTEIIRNKGFYDQLVNFADIDCFSSHFIEIFLVFFCGFLI